MTRRPRPWPAFLALAVALGACSKRPSPAPSPKPTSPPAATPTLPPVPPSPVLATYEGGTVTVADVDGAILDLPRQRRRPPDGDYLRWYERIARELAFTRIVEASARKSADPLPESTRLEARRQAVAFTFVDSLPPIEPPTEKEVREYYEAHRAEFRGPEARLVLHLFRRNEQGKSPETTLAEVEKIRERALSGEAFESLVAAESQSESRHQGGALGWVRRGRFRKQLEDVIFGLPVKTPSAPFVTPEGVHLFYVSAVQEAWAHRFEEARRPLALRLYQEKRSRAIHERVPTKLPEGSVVPDLARLEQLFEEGEPEAVVLSVGDYTLRLRDFQRMLLAAASSIDRPPGPLAPSLVATLVERELIYRYCVAKGLDRTPEVEKREERILRRESWARDLRRYLAEGLAGREGAVRRHWELNRARFSEPLRVRVEVVSVPLEPDANAKMARLEAAASNPAGLSAASLARELGGEVRDLGWQTLLELETRSPRAGRLAAKAKAGDLTQPLRTEDRIEVLHVLERREPEPLPYEKARDRVVDDLLARSGHDEYTRRLEESLKRVGFRVDQARLDEMVRRPPA